MIKEIITYKPDRKRNILTLFDYAKDVAKDMFFKKKNEGYVESKDRNLISKIEESEKNEKDDEEEIKDDNNNNKKKNER